MRATIIIGSTEEESRDLEQLQLPTIRIYETKEGEYILLETKVVERAIIESLNKFRTEQQPVALIEIQIVPISQR